MLTDKQRSTFTAMRSAFDDVIAEAEREVVEYELNVARCRREIETIKLLRDALDRRLKLETP